MSRLSKETGHKRWPSRILVVEDEPVVRFNIAEALRDLGVAVLEAGTADEAWEYLAAEASIDLVFTDDRMPGSMSGTQLSERISVERPAVKVIVTSGHIGSGEAGHRVLRKPYPLMETAAVLVRLAQEDK